MTIQVKATEPYFSVVLFSVLYEVAVTFDSVDENHKSKILDPVFSAVIQLLVLSFLGGSSVHSPERRSSSIFVAILLCFNLYSLIIYATAHLGIVRETWISSTNTNRR